MADKKPAEKKKRTLSAHTYYEKKGEELTRTKKSCPKCGAGYFMAAHKDRSYCGKCKYTEFSSKE